MVNHKSHYYYVIVNVLSWSKFQGHLSIRSYQRTIDHENYICIKFIILCYRIQYDIIMMIIYIKY